MRKTLFGIGTAVLLASSFAAQAQPIERGHGPHMQHKRVMQALDFTEAQKEELKALRKGNKEERKANRDEMREAHQWIRSNTELLMEQPEFDATLAAEIAERKTEFFEAREQKKLQAQFEFRQVLTSEQLAKLEELRERKGDHKGAWKKSR